jgi:hypothetical protein
VKAEGRGEAEVGGNGNGRGNEGTGEDEGQKERVVADHCGEGSQITRVLHMVPVLNTRPAHT